MSDKLVVLVQRTQSGIQRSQLKSLFRARSYTNIMGRGHLLGTDLFQVLAAIELLTLE